MKYNDKKIEELYNLISQKYEQNLKMYNVQMIELFRNKKYTINALILIYFVDHIGKIVTKQELTEFLRTMGYDTNDVQQARHLAQQKGWYILSGSRGDFECKDLKIKAGEYMLKTLDEPYPSYKKLKREESLSIKSWDELKEAYEYRCATCGSKEGEHNFLYPASVTKLHKGHKDPTKPLTLDNTIPQCSFCNAASKDYFVFDEKGKVEKINNPHFILRSSKEVQIEMLKLLIENNYEIAKKIIDKGN